MVYANTKIYINCAILWVDGDLHQFICSPSCLWSTNSTNH